MNPFEASAEVYSPRWGHTDTYRFKFEMDRFEVSHGPKKLVAIWHDGGDPEWKVPEGLTDVMKNDGIYPPHDIEGLLEYVWKAWRDGQLSDDQAQHEVTAFIGWVNESTAAKPRTDFWRTIF